VSFRAKVVLMLFVVLVAVLHFAGYMRYSADWVSIFVNCVFSIYLYTYLPTYLS